MIQTIIKRDGRVVGYNEEKIKAAIRKAMLQTELGEDETLINKITDRISMTGEPTMTVEQIQDRVELELMKSPRKEVAKKYIAYRDQRSIARRAKTRDIFLEIIEAKNNDITRENANMNTDSPAGMMMKFASETTKPFVDDYLLSAEARDAVRNGYLLVELIDLELSTRLLGIRPQCPDVSGIYECRTIELPEQEGTVLGT